MEEERRLEKMALMDDGSSLSRVSLLAQPSGEFTAPATAIVPEHSNYWPKKQHQIIEIFCHSKSQKTTRLNLNWLTKTLNIASRL